MKNPVKLLRELADVSVRKLAVDSQMQPSVIQAMESGLFPALSDAQKTVLRTMCEDNGLPWHEVAVVLQDNYRTQSVSQAYQSWQLDTRGDAADQIAVEPVVINGGSPFRLWRIAVAGPYLKTFCKLLCVPPATIQRYESGKTKTMPAALREALYDADYEWVEKLDDLQRKWAIEHE